MNELSPPPVSTPKLFKIKNKDEKAKILNFPVILRDSGYILIGYIVKIENLEKFISDEIAENILAIEYKLDPNYDLALSRLIKAGIDKKDPILFSKLIFPYTALGKVSIAQKLFNEFEFKIFWNKSLNTKEKEKENNSLFDLSRFTTENLRAN